MAAETGSWKRVQRRRMEAETKRADGWKKRRTEMIRDEGLQTKEAEDKDEEEEEAWHIQEAPQTDVEVSSSD